MQMRIRGYQWQTGESITLHTQHSCRERFEFQPFVSAQKTVHKNRWGKPNSWNLQCILPAWLSEGQRLTQFVNVLDGWRGVTSSRPLQWEGLSLSPQCKTLLRLSWYKNILYQGQATTGKRKTSDNIIPDVLTPLKSGTKLCGERNYSWMILLLGISTTWEQNTELQPVRETSISKWCTEAPHWYWEVTSCWLKHAKQCMLVYMLQTLMKLSKQNQKVRNRYSLIPADED